MVVRSSAAARSFWMMPPDSTNCFQTLDLGAARDALSALHELVARQRGRVEISGAGPDDSCILISKTELDALEKALAILAKTDGMGEMHDLLLRLAAATTQFDVPV